MVRAPNATERQTVLETRTRPWDGIAPLLERTITLNRGHTRGRLQMHLDAVGPSWRGPAGRKGETQQVRVLAVQHPAHDPRFQERSDPSASLPPHPPSLLGMVEEPQDAARQKIGAAGRREESGRTR